MDVTDGELPHRHPDWLAKLLARPSRSTARSQLVLSSPQLVERWLCYC
jgi:hypothetical protein